MTEVIVFLHLFTLLHRELEHEVHVTTWEAALLPGSCLTQNVIHP